MKVKGAEEGEAKQEREKSERTARQSRKCGPEKALTRRKI